MHNPGRTPTRLPFQINLRLFRALLLSISLICSATTAFADYQTDNNASSNPTALQDEPGNTHSSGDSSPNHPSSGMTSGRVLTGSVQTLQQAIQSERETVDWYAWYLAARDYLDRTGRLHCPIGTPIKFYRNGFIQPLSDNSACQASLQGRHFSLPPNTQLEALVLPVRSGNGPPASRQEINKRVQQEE